MIKKFILKSILYSTILGLSIVSVFIFPFEFLKKHGEFQLEDNISMIIIGHSHPECAFDDSKIINFRNLSNAGQSYFYLLPKLRKVLESNSQIETVFIEFSNGQIEERMDDWIWGNDKLSNFYPVYAPFLEKSDHNLLLKNNPKGVFSTVPIVAKKNLGRVLTMDLDYSDDIGNFKPLKKSIIDSLINNRKIGISEPSNPNPKLSLTHLEYLDKIIKVCKEKKIKVILVRSPQHRYYNYRANEEIFQKILKERYNDLEFLDFNDFPLTDEQFGDFSHVNEKGAEVFSIWFNKEIIGNLQIQK
jgi:hypothetical protein